MGYGGGIWTKESSLPGPIYEFGDFLLDCGRFELLRNGKPVRVERKPMELLILLASRQGQLVSRAEIAERLWSREVFVDTEHGINTAIRKLRHLLRDKAGEPKYIQTVTGMGYRFVAPVLIVQPEASGSPDVLGEASSEPEEDTVMSPLPVQRTRVPVILLGSGVAALIISGLAFALGPHSIAARLLSRNTRPAISSIAVIPLDNLSGDPNQEYFADGMTDELITMLAKDSKLRITSRTSVMQYKGAHQPLPEIARALNVDGIVEGSISRSNDRVHMTLQLIRADTDKHVWANSYDRIQTDVASLPDKAARDIADELHSSVNQPSKMRYVSPEAYDAYLRGNFFWFRGRNEEALQAFRKAVQLQPDYALGWVGLSEVYGVAAYNSMNPGKALSLEEEDARKALALDDQLADAHLVMGAAYFFGHWDFARGLQEVSRATELDPRDAQAWHFRARLLASLGRFDEAIADQKQATLLDPFSRPWGMVEVYNWAHRFDDAIADGRARLSYAPDVNWVLTDSYRDKRMWKESEEALEQESVRKGNPSAALAIHRAFESGGYRAVVEWQLNQLLAQKKSGYASPGLIALRYAELGNRERTVFYLEEALREHSTYLLEVQNEPAFDFVHSDPRYRAIIQRIGFPLTN